MTVQKCYAGIDKDIQGGMTATGKIVRDAWVFGLIPPTETFEGWRTAGIEDLWRKVSAEWDKYGFLPSNLPDDLRARFMDIQAQAILDARAAGWSGEAELAADG